MPGRLTPPPVFCGGIRPDDPMAGELDITRGIRPDVSRGIRPGIPIAIAAGAVIASGAAVALLATHGVRPDVPPAAGEAASAKAPTSEAVDAGPKDAGVDAAGGAGEAPRKK